MSLINTAGLRSYGLVEVFLNSRLFHVDFLPKQRTSEGRQWSRFIFAEVNELIDFLDQESHERIKISLQLRRADNADREYRIVPLDAIYQAHDGAGQLAYVLVAKTGQRIVDSLLAADESELTGLSCCWQYS
jgi:hypothetical protein